MPFLYALLGMEYSVVFLLLLWCFSCFIPFLLYYALSGVEYFVSGFYIDPSFPLYIGLYGCVLLAPSVRIYNCLLVLPLLWVYYLYYIPVRISCFVYYGPCGLVGGCAGLLPCRLALSFYPVYRRYIYRGVFWLSASCFGSSFVGSS